MSTLRHSAAAPFANAIGLSRTLFVAGFVFAAHLLLFLPASPPVIAAAAAFVLLIAAPGLLLASLLINDAHEPLPAAEWISYGIGGGFGIGTLTVLLAGMLPGPLSRPLLLAACDGLLLVLLLLLWWQRRVQTRLATPAQRSAAPAAQGTNPLRWAALGGLVLLLLAGTRLANLGYSQLQGDEATPIVRAEGFVQDNENAVFLQPRGPLDMMIPAGIMVLSGSRTELVLRLPFALANATVTLAVWSLGAALAGGPVAWLAALLYALDGYAIAFGRVMHYESVILLVTAAAVLALYRAVVRQRQPSRGSEARIGGYFRVAALLAATGLLAHYDGSLIILTGAYLLFVLWREGMSAAKLGRLLVGPLALVVALTVPFYVAFVLNPNFADTFGRYSQSLVEEGGLLVNNLLLFAESTALYYGVPGFYFMACTLWLAAAHVFWSQRRRPWAAVVLALVLSLPLVLAAQALGAAGGLPFDLAPLWFGVIGAAILFAPGVAVEERLLWIWFGVPFYASLFLVETPGLHFYVFSVPAALLAALTLHRFYCFLSARFPRVAVRVVALGGLACLVLAGSVYLFQFFLSSDELAMQAEAERRAPFLWPAPVLSSAPLFYGVPYDGGWRTVGALFADGTLRGSYRSNIDRWLTDWYTGGAEFCRNEPDYLILDTFTRPLSAQKLLDDLGDGYHLQMRVTNNGQPRLLIYGRENVGDVEDLSTGTEGGFGTVGTDRRLPITPWSGPAPMQPFDVRFGEDLAVKGMRVDFEQIPGASVPDQMFGGESIYVTLDWEMLQQTGRDYKVFLQLINSHTHKASQRDTTPACAEGPTTEWNAGDTATGYYHLSTSPHAPEGFYSLIFGVYDAATQALLPAYDGDGNALGDTVTLRQLRVVVPPGPSAPDN